MSALENMLRSLKTPASKAEGSLATDTLRAVAEELTRIRELEIDYMPYRFFPTLATGEDLTLAARNFGVERKGATKARVELSVIGSAGTYVNKWTKAAAGGVIFQTEEGCTIPPSGSVKIPAIALETGARGNVLANSVSEFVTEYIGLDSVINQAAAVGGADEENDTDLLLRVKARWENPSTGGNRSDYIRWALSVEGASRAKVFASGGGRVEVCVVGADNTVANDELLTRIADAIEEVRPVGALVSVTAAESLLINVEVTLKLYADAVQNAVGEQIKRNLQKLFLQIPFGEGGVSYPRIAGLLYVDGVEEVTDYTVNGGKINIVVTERQFAKSGEVTLNATR